MTQSHHRVDTAAEKLENEWNLPPSPSILVTAPQEPHKFTSLFKPGASQNMISELVHSAMVLSKKKVPKSEEEIDRSLPLFDMKLLAFQFKDRDIKRGQYRLPFAFKLPKRLPGSFKFSQMNMKKSTISERILIEYTVEVFIEWPNREDG